MGISQEYFEAAAIDGATKFQMIRKITIPLLMPLITIMTLLSIGKIFYSDFGLFFFVPREIGQLFPVTQVIDTYVYPYAEGFRRFGNVFGCRLVPIYDGIYRRPAEQLCRPKSQRRKQTILEIAWR